MEGRGWGGQVKAQLKTYFGVVSIILWEYESIKHVEKPKGCFY